MGHGNVYLPLALMAVLAILLLFAMLVMSIRFMWRRRASLQRGFVQLFIAFDQLLNVLSNPFSQETWADETLSARCGRLGHRNPYKFWKRVIDALFFWQGPNHCVNAFEKERTMYHSPPATRIPAARVPQPAKEA